MPCVLIVLAACSRNTSQPVPESKAQAAAAPSAAEPPQGPAPGNPPQLPPGHVPIGPSAGSAPSDRPLGEEAAGGLTFEGKAPFVRRVPGSSMRAAEYIVEGAPEWPLTVFFFPGQGGGVEANVQRWVGQFHQKDGADSKDAAEVTHSKVAGLDVTRVEVRGAYGGGMTLPGKEAQTLDEGMLLAAIAEGAEGPVFFKWVGPASLLTEHEKAFDALIASIAPSP